MRLKTIILTDLINDQLKAQEKIERAMNNVVDDIDDVCGDIIDGLHELAILDLMISKWKGINPTNVSTLEKDNGKKEL